MPAYEKKMTPEELERLVNWMARDYYPTRITDYPSMKDQLPNMSQTDKQKNTPEQ